MLEVITKIVGTFIKDIIVISFYTCILFFLSPIVLYIVFIHLTKRLQNRYVLLLIIFIIFNIIIGVFVCLSVTFWTIGVIHDISFSYALYNIIRVEWLYLLPTWIFFITIGVLRLIRIKDTWKEWVSWFEIN